MPLNLARGSRLRASSTGSNQRARVTTIHHRGSWRCATIRSHWRESFFAADQCDGPGRYWRSTSRRADCVSFSLRPALLNLAFVFLLQTDRTPGVRALASTIGHSSTCPGFRIFSKSVIRFTPVSDPQRRRTTPVPLGCWSSPWLAQSIGMGHADEEEEEHSLVWEQPPRSSGPLLHSDRYSPVFVLLAAEARSPRRIWHRPGPVNSLSVFTGKLGCSAMTATQTIACLFCRGVTHSIGSRRLKFLPASHPQAPHSSARCLRVREFR